MIPIQITITSNESSPWIELLKTAGPLLGAGVGAGIAGWFAIRSFRTNQWWDARHKAYQKVIESLDECLQKCEDCLKLKRQDDTSSYGTGFITSPIGNAKEAYRDAGKTLKGLISRGRFNMSSDALHVLIQTIRDIQSIERSDLEEMQALSLVRNVLTSKISFFSHVAKKDLQIYTPWTQFKNWWQDCLQPSFHEILSRWPYIWRALKLLTLTIWWGEAEARRIIGPPTISAIGPTVPIKQNL